MMKYIISCDLGGTKCAIGLIEYNPITDDFTCIQHHTVKLKETVSLTDLIQQLETGLGFKMVEADAICIGAAGQYTGETLVYPYPYPMHFLQLARTQQWPPFAVIHDYAPIVCATFTSYMEKPGNIKRLNSAEICQTGRRVALGLGTGLGIKDGALLATGDFWLGQNEIGHIGIVMPPDLSADRYQLHTELMRFLHQQHQPVTFEKILSGPGTVNLYRFFYPEQEKISAEAIGLKMRMGLATEVQNTLAWYLGIFIGTVQLIFMPEGGIWITGGVTLQHLDLFTNPDFFAGIHASPAYSTQREHYPLGILCNPEHALIGGGYYASKRLLR